MTILAFTNNVIFVKYIRPSGMRIPTTQCARYVQKRIKLENCQTTEKQQERQKEKNENALNTKEGNKVDIYDQVQHDIEQQKRGGIHCQDVSIDAARLNAKCTHAIPDGRKPTKDEVDEIMQQTRDTHTVIGGG
jgi:hypothetical protein